MTSGLIQLMTQLDFKLEIAQSYSVLLTNGPLSLQGISNKTRQSFSSTHQSIAQLMSLRLVGSDYQRDHHLYYATDPSLAWLSLVADLVWATKVDIGPIRSLRATNDVNIENLRSVCEEVSKLAQSLYRPHSSVLNHRERDAETIEELSRLTCEIILHANEEILAVSKSPRLPTVSSFWAVLTRKIEEGVRYHRIVDLEEIIDHGIKIKARDMDSYNIDLRVLENEQIRHKFYVADKNLVAISHDSGETVKGSRRGVGRITNHSLIVKRYRKRFFDDYADKAIPGRFVLSHMQTAANAMLHQAALDLKPIEVFWIEDLINYGRFSRFHKTEDWSEKFLALVEERATKGGFVHRNLYGDIVPVYPTSEASLRIAYSQFLGVSE